MPPSLAIEPPATGQDFERWCWWLARAKYGPEVFLYPRHKQHGIDIYWTRQGRYSVIQCKQRSGSEPTNAAELIRSLEEDLQSALAYFQPLEHFIFAATISLEAASRTCQRQHRTESLMDAAARLAAEHRLEVTCWHWDAIRDDIAASDFLLARLYGKTRGGELIGPDFLDGPPVYSGPDELKKAFYGGIKEAQWPGIVAELDIGRLAYDAVKQAIETSFGKSHAVAALVTGEGGSGKSVLLRRLAYDLRGDYAVYWLDGEIRHFLECEWRHDILHGKPNRYLIFLEDWYQRVENRACIQEAAELLDVAGKHGHARLVIGDRPAKPGQNKTYERHISAQARFALGADENPRLLDALFAKMPEWRGKVSPEQIANAAQATLFQLLFIFQYADNLQGDILDIYQGIFKSDCNRLLGREGRFWTGIAKAIVFYAHLYSREGVMVSGEFLRDLAAYLGECEIIPQRYGGSLDALIKDAVIRKYFSLDRISPKNKVPFDLLRFHHDTMAEQGWMPLETLAGEHYCEDTLNAVLESFKEKHLETTGWMIYLKRSKLPGQKGLDAARAYLSLNHPENNHFAFIACPLCQDSCPLTL